MTTLSLKGVKRRKKKVLIVNKDLAPAHPMTSSSTGPKSEKATGTLRLKKKTKAPTPQPKKVLPTKKPRKPPPSPPILAAKRIERILTLCDTYPELFSIENPKPLSIGIAEELIAKSDRTLSKKAIRSGIQHYTNLPQYHRAVLQQNKRINAKGIESEAPETEHLDYAKKRLDWWLGLPDRWPAEFTSALDQYPNLFDIKKFEY